LLLLCTACEHVVVVGQATANRSIAILEEFYNSLDGNHWDWPSIAAGLSDNTAPGVPWNFTKNALGFYLHDPCFPQGAGIRCDCSLNNNKLCVIYGMILGGQSLRGTIPSSILSLDELQAVFVQSEFITGTIPNEIGNAASLQYWYTMGTSMGGTIPNSIGNLQNFVDLHITGPGYYGTIPAAMGNMKYLESLDIDGCTWSGKFPDLCNATSLRQIYVSGPVTGTLPACLGNIKKLELISLANTALTGTIPKEYGQLQDLQDLDLHNSLFTGILPAELVNCRNLLKIDLSNSSISGQLPKMWGNLRLLEFLDLSFNHLSGTLPSEWKNMSAIKSIDVSANHITGSIPQEWALLRKTLYRVNFWWNSFDFDLESVSWLRNMTGLSSIDFGLNPIQPGKIPSWLGQMAALTYLSLDSTSRTGQILPELFELKNLVELKLGNNSLTGTLPSTIGKSANLQQLVVSYNNLTGDFPKEMGALHLELLLANNNQFTDSQALQTLSNISVLTILDLSVNDISGTIPTDFFRKTPVIEVFAIGSNCFTGSVPDNICVAKKMSTLLLTGMTAGQQCIDKTWENTFLSGVFNGYTPKATMQGTLPQCIFQMPALQSLHVGGLGLRGTLPINISKSLTVISLPFNAISGTIPLQLATNLNLYHIDLSYNRLTGNLSVFEHSNGNQNLTATVNYLSGPIPQQIAADRSINILEGNVFQCGGDSKLPEHDPTAPSYVCASDSYEIGIYAYITALFVLAVVAWVINTDSKVKEEFRLWLRSARAEVEPRVEGDHGTKIRPIYQFNLHLRNLRWISLKIALMFLGVLIMYLSLPDSRLLQHSYLWSTTAAYMTGDTATICLLIIGFILNCAIVHIMRNEHKNVEGEEVQLRNSVFTSSASSGHSTYIFKPLLRILIFIVIIIGFVVVGNVMYLRVLFVGTQLEQQVFRPVLALFKLIWAYVVTPKFFYSEYLLFGLPQSEHLQFINKVFGLKIHFMFIMNILTLFCIPIMVQMCTDPACFYNVFMEFPETSVRIKYDSCSIFTTEKKCTDVVGTTNGIWFLTATGYSNTHTSTISVHPPFIYNYSCSSAVINAYVPLYAAIFTFQILVCLLNVLHLRNDIQQDVSGPIIADNLDYIATNNKPSVPKALEGTKRPIAARRGGA